jgi:hypothetical protein
MNNTLIVIGAFALAIGTSFVVAQTAPQHPANTPPTQNPPPTDTPAPPRSNMPMTGHQTMTPTTPPDFRMLDKSGLGYVTQQQAASDPWLSKNFAMCDANHDAQVTTSEYAGCSKNP